MAARPKTSRRHKLLAFAPALVVVGITALTASGLSVISGATAASTVTVNGTVATTFTTDPGITGGGGATGCADETLAAFETNFVGTNGCQISFTSNNANGTEVVFQSDSATDTQFFCSDPDGAGPGARNCADAAAVDDVTGTGNTITASSDRFGIALMSVGGTGPTLSTVAGSGVSAADPTPTGAESIWAEIPNTAGAEPAAQLCRLNEPNATTSTCQFNFGAAGSGGTQGAGDYSGTLRLTNQLL